MQSSVYTHKNLLEGIVDEYRKHHPITKRSYTHRSSMRTWEMHRRRHERGTSEPEISSDNIGGSWDWGKRDEGESSMLTDV